MTALLDQGIPSVVAGDFNCIDELVEKSDKRPFVKDIGDFNCIPMAWLILTL